MKLLRHSAAVFAAILFSAATAEATPNFPGALAGTLGAPAPACSICHVCGVTGRGTVNTPWGSSMRARGLQAYDEGSLRAAAAKMEEEKVDSDGDGTIDVAALREGKDPNPPTCDAEADPTIPIYGCVGRIAPGDSLPSGLFLVVAAAFVLVARRRGGASGVLGLVVCIAASSALAACSARSGAALATRSDQAVRSGSFPRMAPLAKSAFADELKDAGLDPANLPRFEALTPKQRRRVMGTFTRSLGVACTECHDRADYRTSTRTQWITIQMWNDLTRPYHLEDGGIVYCDSCHRGEARFLDRRDKKLVAAFMGEQFLGRLVRHDKKAVECETCHGDPFRPLVLPR